MKRLHLALLLGLAGTMSAQAWNSADSVMVRGIRGTVLNAQGVAAGGARAELIDCFTNQVTKIALADAQGRFMLLPDREQTSYCLRFSGDGLATKQVTVKARDFSRSMQVKVLE